MLSVCNPTNDPVDQATDQPLQDSLDLCICVHRVDKYEHILYVHKPVYIMISLNSVHEKNTVKVGHDKSVTPG